MKWPLATSFLLLFTPAVRGESVAVLAAGPAVAFGVADSRRTVVPDIEISPLTLDFGYVDVSDSVEMIATVMNVGSADLTVT